MAEIIAVANQKGGVGKTTTAINLGAYIAALGHSVLLVDLDPQANTTSGLGLDKRGLNQSIYHALFDPSLAESIMHHTDYHQLSLFPATPELAAAEVDLVQELGREHKLKELLSRVDFEYIIIDCPPSLSLLTINALTAADHILIPVQAEYYALEGLSQLLETIQRVRQALNPQLDLLGVLVTMHDNRTTLSDQVHAEVKKHFPGKAFDVVIPRNVRLAEAPSHGKPIHAHDKWSKGARSYKNLAKEVKKRVEKRSADK
ncbi:MAG: ParA family protein [Candidatus Saccharimonadales bacterium]|nr:ParA family protein [Candidatus Saccharimonadales bacterium]